MQSVLSKLQPNMKLKFNGFPNLTTPNRLFTMMSEKINTITGYDECEKLRKRVELKDAEYIALQSDASKIKQIYEQSIQTRSKCQREINSLLQRKHLWNEDEVTKFTLLYRDEMKMEQDEALNRQKHKEAEQSLERAHNELVNSLRERYQHEQLWSDKIRQMSTIGTFSLMLVNILLFVLVQTVTEPRKREALKKDFEKLLVAEIDSIKDTINTAMTKDQYIHSQSVFDTSWDSIWESIKQRNPLVLSAIAFAAYLVWK